MDERAKYKPMFDEPYLEALSEWFTNHALWEKGEHPDQPSRCRYYAQWIGDPPEIAFYPTWNPEEATWWQVYETVSEGTPVSPPFATQAELVDYLVANGDFWDQLRRIEGIRDMNCSPWTRQQAERFVYRGGWAPSGIMKGGVISEGHRVED